MQAVAWMGAVSGGLLLLLAVASLFSKIRVALAPAAGLVALGVGLATGTVLRSDGLQLPAMVGLQQEVWLLLASAAFGGLAAAAGGLRVPGPPVLGAALSGALLGELGAAAALAQVARDRRGGARLVLAAMAGGMVGRIGDPAILALGPRLDGREWMLLPLALGMLLVAWPTRECVREAGGSAAVTAVAALVGVAAWLWPEHRFEVLGVGCLPMLALAAAQVWASERKGEVMGQVLGPLLWTAGSVLVVLVVTAGGLPELAASGIEEFREQIQPWLGPLAGASGALLAALVDGPAAGLLGAGILDRALSLRAPDAHLALAAGLAAGSLGPLVIAGALREGLLRWVLQVGLAVAWAGWLLS